MKKRKLEIAVSNVGEKKNTVIRAQLIPICQWEDATLLQEFLSEASIVKYENWLGCHSVSGVQGVCMWPQTKQDCKYVSELPGQPWLFPCLPVSLGPGTQLAGQAGSSPSLEMTSTHHRDSCSMAVKTGLRSSCPWEAILSPELSQPLFFF